MKWRTGTNVTERLAASFRVSHLTSLAAKPIWPISSPVTVELLDQKTHQIRVFVISHTFITRINSPTLKTEAANCSGKSVLTENWNVMSHDIQYGHLSWSQSLMSLFCFDFMRMIPTNRYKTTWLANHLSLSSGTGQITRNSVKPCLSLRETARCLYSCNNDLLQSFSVAISYHQK